LFNKKYAHQRAAGKVGLAGQFNMSAKVLTKGGSHALITLAALHVQAYQRQKQTHQMPNVPL